MENPWKAEGTASRHSARTNIAVTNTRQQESAGRLRHIPNGPLSLKRASTIEIQSNPQLTSSESWGRRCRRRWVYIIQFPTLINLSAYHQVSEDELGQALRAAVVCCILAKAGPQRSRILANLYKDERTAHLDLFPFMEKVYLERILRHDEVQIWSWDPCFAVWLMRPDMSTAHLEGEQVPPEKVCLECISRPDEVRR